MAIPRRYQLPAFLEAMAGNAAYERWLERKARSHLKRDRKRGNTTATKKEYKIEIHRAVLESNGYDFYTGEQLDWALISTYKNELSRQGRRTYKAAFAFLPTIDHINDGIGPAEFKICAWRTNDAKNDMSYRDFVSLCRKIASHHCKVNSAD